MGPPRPLSRLLSMTPLPVVLPPSRPLLPSTLCPSPLLLSLPLSPPPSSPLLRRDLRRPPPRCLPLRRQPPRLRWQPPPRLCRLPLRWISPRCRRPCCRGISCVCPRVSLLQIHP